MKVRIGLGFGALGSTGPSVLSDVVDTLDDLGFDSIWLPEVLTVPALDPLTGLAFAAAHNPHLKLGTTIVLPGRNPLRVAKELATLDLLSGGRLLVTVVPGISRQPEAGAVGGARRDKEAMMDETIPLLRRLWAGEHVTHHGPFAQLDDVVLAPLPTQRPLEVWTGGMAPTALRRCGLHADGWLPSTCTPDEVATARASIEETARSAGRAISPEHFGVSIGYSSRPLDAEILSRIGSRRPNVDPFEVVPVGLDGLRAMLERFIGVGFSKFVVRPLEPPRAWPAELSSLADALLDLQT